MNTNPARECLEQQAAKLIGTRVMDTRTGARGIVQRTWDHGRILDVSVRGVVTPVLASNCRS